MSKAIDGFRQVARYQRRVPASVSIEGLTKLLAVNQAAGS